MGMSSQSMGTNGGDIALDVLLVNVFGQDTVSGKKANDDSLVLLHGLSENLHVRSERAFPFALTSQPKYVVPLYMAFSKQLKCLSP
jgi:hypothetical protein